MALAAPSFDSQLIRQHFELFDEFAEAAQGWDLNFCQLGRANAPFYLEQLSGPSIMISRAFLSPGFYQAGGATPGCRTVSILAQRAGNGSWRWCGESVTLNSMLIMPVGGEFESVSAPDLDSIHLTIPIALLEQVAESQFNLPLYLLMPDTRCFCPDGGEHLRRLRTLLQEVTHGPEEGNRANITRLTHKLETEMAYLVLATLKAGETKSPSGPRSSRMKCFATALEVLNESSMNTLEVGRLAQAVGVSRRTLENAFFDALGVGPAAFLKSRRLQCLNEALLGANPGSGGVAALAQAHGFRHLGQLASDYRSLFGELPSATLRRGWSDSRGNRAPT